MRVKLFLPGPAQYKAWRAELGLTEEDMAAKAGITLEEYKWAENPDGSNDSIHAKVIVAFRDLGKTPIAETGHSTLQ
ncbi:MAG: hypothetical protein WBA48_00720 [Xanthobacteraceae bacterium]